MRILLQNKYYPIVSCPSPTQSYSCWWDDDRDCNLCDISPLPSFLECTMFVFRTLFPIQYLLGVNFPHHISNIWIKQCCFFEIWVWFIRSGKRKSRVIRNPVFFVYLPLIAISKSSFKVIVNFVFLKDGATYFSVDDL